MPDTFPMADRHRANLTELAELGMALARGLHGRAMAAADAGDDEAAAELALAFHRISRSVRQSMALEGRLEREHKADLRDEARERARKTLERVQRRRQEVRDALEPLIWTEAEGDEDEADALFAALEHRLMAYGPEDGDFADQPLEACVEAIGRDLRLVAANTVIDDDADGGDNDADAGPADRRSSG